MPSKKINRTPWFLVIASMILLFMFVGYWNVSSYLREQKKLAEDVEIQLQLAFTETKDYELVYFIKSQLGNTENGDELPDSISIFLDDNPVFPSLKKLELGLDGNSTHHDTTIILDIEYNSSKDSIITKKINRREVTVLSSNNINTVVLDDLKNIVHDSTKLDFRFKQFNTNAIPGNLKNRFFPYANSKFKNPWLHLNDSLSNRSNIFFANGNDSLAANFRFNALSSNQSNSSVDKTYALFKEKLIANNLPSHFDIVNDPNKTENGLRVIYKSKGFGFSDWIIDLTKYRIFIFKKMIPIMLFSIFLLGVIGLAFWTLLRNWIKQNRLVIVKNEFINNMTHELKTPIATVGVALEAISNFDLASEKEKTKEYLDISRNEISRLSLLVDKVLNIATFDSNEITLNSEVVNLNQIIQNNIHSLKLQLDGKNAQIEFISNIDSPIILGDKLHVDNAIHNIIDNALKYSRSNPKIVISINENQNNLVLSIKDNGKGIPKEYQNKIFDRFFRVPSDDRHDVKGHGLGLNYVQNVIQSHGGKISLESVENQGSTFTIALPKTDSNV